MNKQEALKEIKLSQKENRRANLQGADLQGANLQWADLQGASLQEANLQGADLQGANLQWAKLQGANLQGAKLQGANLQWADLSGAKNMFSPTKWLAENFKYNKKGLIVYKAILNTTYTIPETWDIKENSFLEEIVNPLPTCDCACGVNFGTLDFVKKTYPNSDIWECLIHIRDLPCIVVPYNTDGKARCGRLQLIKIVKEEK